MKRLLRGAVAGTVATAPMSAVMMGAKQFGLMGGMPPEKITAKVLKRSGIRPSSEQQDALATVLHFAFGTAAGAAFGVVAPKRAIARVPLGMAYGASIWGVSYMGWVPAFGIMPPSHRDRRDRQMVMFAGHLVYGAVLAILVGRRADQSPSEADHQG
ncbi:MAG: DUF6789 family protein [Candidatus Dormibacteria bacterium]